MFTNIFKYLLPLRSLSCSSSYQSHNEKYFAGLLFHINLQIFLKSYAFRDVNPKTLILPTPINLNKWANLSHLSVLREPHFLELSPGSCHTCWDCHKAKPPKQFPIILGASQLCSFFNLYEDLLRFFAEYFTLEQGIIWTKPRMLNTNHCYYYLNWIKSSS